MGGLIKTMPVTAVAFLLCAFSVMGIPPFGGFFSKYMVISRRGPGRADWPWPWSSWSGAFLTILYLFRVFTMVFLGEPRSRRRPREGSPVMVGVRGAPGRPVAGRRHLHLVPVSSSPRSAVQQMTGGAANERRNCCSCPIAAARGRRARWSLLVRRRSWPRRARASPCWPRWPTWPWRSALFGSETAVTPAPWARIRAWSSPCGSTTSARSSCWRRPASACWWRSTRWPFMKRHARGSTSSTPTSCSPLGFVNGAVLADNLVVLLFFWEGLLLTLFGMIAIGRPGRLEDRHQGVHHRRRHRPVHDGRHRPDRLHLAGTLRRCPPIHLPLGRAWAAWRSSS